MKFIYNLFINWVKRNNDKIFEEFLSYEENGTAHNLPFYLKKLSGYSLLNERNTNVLVIKILYLIKSQEFDLSNQAQKNIELSLETYYDKINRPLHNISNLAELILTEPNKLNIKNHDRIKEIYDNTIYLLNDINDIKEYFLIQNNNLVFNYNFIHLRKLLLQMIDDFKNVHQNKVKFYFEFDNIFDDRIVIDKLKFMKVIKNIISNIITYFKSDNISFNLIVNLENIELQIRHFGQDRKSISDEELHNIFELVFRPKIDINDTNQHNPIGLAYCKLFIERNKGKIYCMNDHSTNSMIFYILLARKNSLFFDIQNATDE
jgi:K+-sensing histidine kinase KdpD